MLSKEAMSNIKVMSIDELKKFIDKYLKSDAEKIMESLKNWGYWRKGYVDITRKRNVKTEEYFVHYPLELTQQNFFDGDTFAIIPISENGLVSKEFDRLDDICGILRDIFSNAFILKIEKCVRENGYWTNGIISIQISKNYKCYYVSAPESYHLFDSETEDTTEYYTYFIAYSYCKTTEREFTSVNATITDKEQLFGNKVFVRSTKITSSEDIKGLELDILEELNTNALYSTSISDVNIIGITILETDKV